MLFIKLLNVYHAVNKAIYYFRLYPEPKSLNSYGCMVKTSLIYHLAFSC